MNPDLHIKLEAARCVACGLCLPHCPTYNLLHDEAESPRGRLSLMLALAKDDLPLNAKLESHLARCLGCRACEKACPSNVGYGQALDAARVLIESRRTAAVEPANRSVALIQWLAEKPARMKRLGVMLRLYQASGLQWLLRKSHGLRLVGMDRLDAAVPEFSSRKTFAENRADKTGAKGRVALFAGCQAPLADRQVLDAAIRLLKRLGYAVHLPPSQGCCGALHLHGGKADKAAELMRGNLEAFANGNDAIVSVASGCAATLGEYGKYLDDATAGKFSGRVRDISQFLADQVWPEDIGFRPLAAKIAVHDPCSLANVLRQESRPHALLARIPGAEIFPLPENNVCCGAAGVYHLAQPAIAERLRAPKIELLRRLAPDILVTANSGCGTFLAAGLREAGLAIEVMHPVTLLARQLEA